MFSAGESTLRTLSPDSTEYFRSVHELPPISLRRSQSDRMLQRSELCFSRLLLLLQKTQGLSDHFTLRLVEPGLEQLRDKLIENWTQINVHNAILPQLSIIVKN